jgi:hypothetical protein
MKKLPKIAKSHITGISFAVAMAATPCLLQAQSAGENLLKNGGAETGDSGGWIEFPSVSATAKEGSKAFVCKSGGRVLSEELIPINPELRYKLSVFFNSEGAEAKMCLGFVSYDADEKEITSAQITPITGTETKLREAASKGDTVLATSTRLFQGRVVEDSANKKGESLLASTPVVVLSTILGRTPSADEYKAAVEGIDLTKFVPANAA